MPYISSLLSKMIRVRTVSYNPADYPEKGPDGMESPGEEYKVARIVEKEFSRLKISYKVFNKGKRPDVIAFIGENKPGYRKLLLAAHMDTVPGGEGWTATKPFFPKIVGNRMYGRGSEDNKGSLAGLIAAAALLSKEKINGQVMIAAVSDEECNMCPGLVSLIKKKIIQPTEAIIPDVSLGIQKISVAEKGIMDLVVRTTGKAAHGAAPQLGNNAISGMSEFLSLLSNYQLMHKHDPLFPDGPTINIGLITGGLAPNVVAPGCEAVLNIRYLPSQTIEAIMAELKQLSSQVSVKGIKFSFTPRKVDPPVRVSPDSVAVAAIRKYMVAKPLGLPGGTVSRILIRAGLSSIGFGPGEASCHMADEYIDLRELERFVVLISKIAVDLANTKTF
jgi:succinyl-diaminopimelate desuccinylase